MGRGGITHVAQSQPLRRNHLSPRELQVLQLLADGKHNVQIAQELVLAEQTVQHHIANAKQKLGAATRAHAIAIAFREGILQVPAPDEAAG